MSEGKAHIRDENTGWYPLFRDVPLYEVIEQNADLLIDKADSTVKKEKTFTEQVNDVLSGKADRYSDLKVCDTPQILPDVGCRQLPILYTQKHLRDSLRPHKETGEAIHHHGLSVEQIKTIPSELSEPVMIYDSLSRNDSIVIVTSQTDNNNLPIIAIIHPDGSGKYNFQTVDSNFLLSIYGRKNFENQLNNALQDDKILYANKEKSQKLFRVSGLQLPKCLNNLDFNIIIHKSRNIVNEKAEEKQGNRMKEL